MARSSSGIVAGLTAAALAAVGFLAYQASANAPANLAAPSKSPSASASPKEKATGSKDRSKGALAVPAQSGSGVRVVYALGDKRVWLVGEPGQKRQTFEVMPSTVSPAPGTYRVTSRSGAVTGSDGVQIEHVVRFTNVENVSIGFSSAVDGTMETPNPATKTGGVRMKRADGNAMWSFATVGAKVVVVP